MSRKEQARIQVLNKVLEKRLEVGAERIVAEREARGPFRSLADVIERGGLLKEALENLADAGTFDALCPDRRAVRWEIGLRYKPPNRQLSLGLPVDQDMVALPGLTPFEKMAGEYRTMALYPQGHLMAYVRKQLKERIAPSSSIQHMRDGERVKVAGLVIRRQRPGTAKGVIFLTLEDEFGHVPIVVWPKEYQEYRLAIKEPLLLIDGFVSHRDGTMNVVAQKARAIGAKLKAPVSKDWG